MTITKFNRLSLKKINNRIESALAVVAKEFGIEIKVGGCSCTDDSATTKVELRVLDKDGNAFDEDAANFKVFAEEFGLKPKDLGKTFITNFTEYTITGLKPRNRKYPILVVNKKGKCYKFPSRLIQKIFSEQVIEEDTKGIR